MRVTAFPGVLFSLRHISPGLQVWFYTILNILLKRYFLHHKIGKSQLRVKSRWEGCLMIYLQVCSVKLYWDKAFIVRASYQRDVLSESNWYSLPQGKKLSLVWAQILHFWAYFIIMALINYAHLDRQTCPRVNSQKDLLFALGKHPEVMAVRALGDIRAFSWYQEHGDGSSLLLPSSSTCPSPP